jgi:hypothetical protein
MPYVYFPSLLQGRSEPFAAFREVLDCRQLRYYSHDRDSEDLSLIKKLGVRSKSNNKLIGSSKSLSM